MIDLHLPISSLSLIEFAKRKIEPHNPDLFGSRAWLKKFSARHNMSLRRRTSISQKLPAQLEEKPFFFFINVPDFFELGGIR